MNATVIDTLRYANSLKAAGVEPRQAEAMSRAINDELTEGVATKRDLDDAVVELKGDIARLDAKFDAKFEGIDAKFDAMDAKFEGMMKAMDRKFDGKNETLNSKLEALSDKVVAQGRYTFLVLALIAGLGLYNAAAPHFVKPSGTATTAQAASDPR